MKHLTRIITHLIVSATGMLFFVNLFESSSKFVGYTLLTMLLVAFLYLLRNKTESFSSFLASHVVLLFGGSLLIGVASTYRWYIMVWSFLILYSAILRLVPKAASLDEPGTAYVILLVVEYLIIRALEMEVVYQSISLISAVLVFLLYLLYGNLKSVDEFIYLGSFSSTVDEQGIRKLTKYVSLLYTGILGMLLAIFGSFRIDGLWDTVSGWMRSLLFLVIRLLPKGEQMQQEEEALAEKEMSNMLQQVRPEHDLPAWRQMLHEVFRGFIAFVLIAIIVVGVIYVAMYVYSRFYNKKNREVGDKVIETLSYDVRVRREKKSRFFERFERNPAKRIRRIYKKSLKRADTKNVSAFWYMSPDEQVQFLRKQGVSEETIDEIKTLYEKARYSADLVTEEEAERMQAII